MYKIWGLILGFLFLMTLGSCSKNSSHNSPVPAGEITSYWYAGVGQFNGSLDFGNLTAEQNKILTVTIKNVGDSSLVGPVTISSSDFFVAYQNCATLLPGKTCSVKISFNSQGKANTSYSADLILGDQSALVTASVDLPAPVTELKALVGGSPISSLNFGSIKFNQSVLKTITVTNGGKDKGPWVVGQSGNGFVVSYDTCSGKEILPTKSCTLKVSLSGAGKSGEVTDTLTLGNLELPLSALVRNLETVAQEDSDIKVILENQAVSSGAVDLGTWNLNQTKILNLFLKNQGEDVGVITEPTIPPELLVAYNNCVEGKVLPANGSCMIKLVNIPASKGSQNLSLTLQGSSYNLQSVIREPGDKIVCPMAHSDSAFITWTGSNYSGCIIEECSPGYTLDDNECVPNEMFITLNQPPAVQGSISGPSSAPFDSEVILTYNLPANYELINWTGDCSGNSLTCAINPIQSDLTVGVNIGCASGYTMVDNECLRVINLTIASNVQNYNLFAAASNPTDKVLLTVTVNSGVVVGSSAAENPSFTTGSGWQTGSILNLINNGTIAGKGGNGAGGNTWTDSPGAGPVGGIGGNAINLNFALNITNDNGLIGGGGGGGGGGSGGANYPSYCFSGAGGGGGAGSTPGSGGPQNGCAGGRNGAAGTIGSLLTGGNNGASANWGSGMISGAGGKGGDLGQPGSAGEKGSGGNKPQDNGGLGGAAGKAVLTNGNLVNWISGNDATHVKGLVQ